MPLYNTPKTITTPAGYQYEEPNFEEKEPINIDLSYKDMYDTILDGIWCESTLEPLTPPTFSGLAESIIHLLVDSYEDQDCPDLYPPMLQMVPDLDENLVHIELPFELAYNSLMDCLKSISTVKPITQRMQEDTAKELTKTLIHAQEAANKM